MHLILHSPLTVPSRQAGFGTDDDREAACGLLHPDTHVRFGYEVMQMVRRGIAIGIFVHASVSPNLNVFYVWFYKNDAGRCWLHARDRAVAACLQRRALYFQ